MSSTNVPIQQLQHMHQQLDTDVKNLAAAYDTLNSVRGRFITNKETIESYAKVVKAQDGKGEDTDEVLVAVTASLFVRGNVVPSEKVLIDVGTGYYIEKNMPDACRYFDSRAAKMKEMMDNTEKALTVKQNEKEQVTYALQQRAAEIEAEQQLQQQ
ncbi:hypothetical protein AGDE_03317 [Angomonas deanei]|uniref:Prefoldin subunit, putative n=1 Tax=Angomonas deanei TaxID=59799 RepID=A0A7G2CEY8_9TRYP|nr:hypothetical protein AGDE_03317 [Angomonas deanei]CAD2218380.1 Prefoldin subunit, putative [Angomonas deanei]|eukprot:EPY40611.1 hypothetical protein AGDE_03317 [Angomonas deanei]